MLSATDAMVLLLQNVQSVLFTLHETVTTIVLVRLTGMGKTANSLLDHVIVNVMDVMDQDPLTAITVSAIPI